MKSSVVVSKLIPVTTKLEAAIEAAAAKAPYKTRIDVAWGALVSWMKAAGKVAKPYPVSCRTQDVDNTLSYSKAVGIIGAENLAVVDLNSYFRSPSLKCTQLTAVPKKWQQEVILAFGALFSRVYTYGFYDDNTFRLWHFVLQSAKQAQVFRGICIADGHEADLLKNIGLAPKDFEGKQLGKYFKVLMNMFSGQLKFADEKYNAAPLTMMDCRGFKKFTHGFHIARHVTYDKDGKRSGMKWEITFTRPTDAVLIVIREMLPFVWLREHTTLSIEEQIELVLSGKFDMTLIKRWLFRGSQSRGAGMKGFAYDYDVVGIGQLMAKQEGDATPTLHLVDEDVPLDIATLARKGIFVLVSQDVMKYGEGESAYFRDYKNPAEAFLESCAFVSNADDLKHEVKLSRQMVATYHGIGKQEVEDLYAMSSEEIAASMEDNELAVKLGIESTPFGMTIAEDCYQAARRLALFSKVVDKGTFAFAAPEVRPMIAAIMGYDYRNHMTLRGATCYFKARRDSLVACVKRYPNLKFNQMVLRIVQGRDEDQYCEAILVLSWDTVYNAILKGDYDGDTPLVTLPRNDKEAKYILANYDFDKWYIPDTMDEVDISEFISVMMMERTISVERFYSIVSKALAPTLCAQVMAAYRERYLVY